MKEMTQKPTSAEELTQHDANEGVHGFDTDSGKPAPEKSTEEPETATEAQETAPGDAGAATDAPDRSPEDQTEDTAKDVDLDDDSVSDNLEVAGLLGGEPPPAGESPPTDAELTAAVDALGADIKAKITPTTAQLTAAAAALGDKRGGGDVEEDKLLRHEEKRIGAALALGAQQDAAGKPDPDPDGIDAAAENSAGEDAEPDIEPQLIEVGGVGGTNQVSIVTYDCENRIIRTLRVSPGTRSQFALVPGERTMMIACSPDKHDELLESWEFDKSFTG